MSQEMFMCGVKLMHVLRRRQKEVLNFSYGIRWGNRVCVPVVNGDSVGLCFLPSVRP